jgi:excinuclease ABC subunit A
MQHIEIIDAGKHNLKHFDLNIPKRQLITITGVSGSGKSTLAYDTIFQEGQRRYLESLSVYARQYIKSLEKPEVRHIKGISPTISIDQKHSSYYYNSTVGTISEVSPYLRLLYARASQPQCPNCGKKISQFSPKELFNHIYSTFPNDVIILLAPVARHRKGQFQSLFQKFLKRGFLKAQIDGAMHYLDAPPDLDRNKHHDIAIQIDAVEIDNDSRQQLKESIDLANFEGNGEVIVRHGDNEYFFSEKLFCSTCNIGLRQPQPATFSFNSPVGACPVCEGSGADQNKLPCPQCEGKSLNPEALSFTFRQKSIADLGDMEVGELLTFFQNLTLDPREQKILEHLLPQIIQRLQSFVKLNLDYITLNRKIDTLSGGELQRTRLVSQIGFHLSGILYILDEPSIGMHMAELDNLLHILQDLKQKGNTVIVVEHDESAIRASDFIVDLGPGSGKNGGHIAFAGPIADFPNATQSLTSAYLYGRKQIRFEQRNTPQASSAISLKGVHINNIKGININIPCGALTVVTGVSGSGKSSLVNDALYPALKSKIDDTPLKHPRFQIDDLKYDSSIQRVLMVDQTAIGKNPRSCPATYVNLMPIIRELFAALPEAKMRGYGPSRFSFNVSGGRCEACKGMGLKKLEMSFLPQLEVTCPVCDGKRFNSETLKIKYKGHSIAGILSLTIVEAYELFKPIPHIAKKLKVLLDVGLGYLELGQNSATLSGGESQRIKLSRELSRISNKRTVYLLDEPTIGLHFDDIQKLIHVIDALTARGDTVILIEHNLEIIRAAGHIIDMGPGGGKHGGEAVYQGPLDGIFQSPQSKTAQYLKPKVNNGT